MMTAQARKIIGELKALHDPVKAAFFPKFFKTGAGEYGEGDVFLGITVPQVRLIAKQHRDATLLDIEALLAHEIHEVRLLGLMILVLQYEKGHLKAKKQIVDFYLKHFDRVNNWDLVDLSAPKILGDFLLTHDRAILRKFTVSKHLWTQRIAIVSTYALIRVGEFEDTLEISEMLLSHPHDLLHKAVGWMLREVGKKDVKTLKKFLDQFAAKMPRTALRYAIERLPERERKAYLSIKKTA